MSEAVECNQTDLETHHTFKLVTSRGTLSSKYQYQQNLPKVKQVEATKIDFGKKSLTSPESSTSDPLFDISSIFVNLDLSQGDDQEEDNKKPLLKEVQVQEAFFATSDSFLQPSTALEQFGELRAPVPDSYYFDGNSMRQGHIFFHTAKSDMAAKLSLNLAGAFTHLNKRATVFVSCDVSYQLISDGKNQYLEFYTVSRDVSEFYGNVDFRLEGTGQLKIKVKKGKLPEYVVIAVLRDRDGKYIEAAPLMYHGKVCSFSTNLL